MRTPLALTFFAFITLPLAYAQNPKPSPYVEAGIPAPSRQWTGADFAQTFQILSSGSIALPRYSDRHGATLLRRMTAIENFSFYKSQSLPIQLRMQDYSVLMQSVSSLMKLYVAHSLKETASANPEMVSLMAFTLRACVVGLELTDEFLPTIPKDDKYATRMEGLKKMNSGITIVFVSAEASLSETNSFSSKDRALILETMAATLPTLKRAFAPDYKLELQQKLRKHRAEWVTAMSRKKELLHIDAMLHELEG
ncbi:MAG: hypothetical protein FWG75_04675 [Cystobacterineae bacterium]|nr:hypothetical protein [Cystobacterineae bacterium]